MSRLHDGRSDYGPAQAGP